MTRSEDAKLPPATALQLAEHVDYSPGSIVSRALVQKRTGSLTLFAFDEGQALSEHTAPFDAWVQVLEGQAELVIGGTVVTARTGEAVLMPATVPHAVNARQRFKMLLTMIRE
jgi:quercetin dioxygenase-like cupin family protein